MPARKKKETAGAAVEVKDDLVADVSAKKTRQKKSITTPKEPRPSKKVKVKAEDDVEPVKKAPRKSKPRAKLVKEESESAWNSLQEIAAKLHASESDSDSSTDRPIVKKDDAANDSDSMDWDEVDITAKPGASAKFDDDQSEADLDLTIEKAERIQLAKTGKKKQSARAVHERCFCHYMSAISLVAHAAWRNTWINDVRLQKILRRWFFKKSRLLHEELVAFARNTSYKRTDHTSTEFVELMGRVMTRFKRHFRRTKPGYRKLGYRHVSRVFEDGQDIIEAAESFDTFDQYLAAAEKMSGSRDFGAQMLTALFRAYHFNVRLVYSVQSLGYKFNEKEQFSGTSKPADAKNTKPATGGKEDPVELESDVEKKPKKRKRAEVINVDDSSDLSDLSELDAVFKQDAVPESGPDTDLEYPIFWTEIYDQAGERWLAIDAMVRSVVLVDEKGFKTLHPKGKAADKSKLQLGLVCAFSANKYAKDVTLRYASSIAKVKDAFLRSDGRSQSQYDANRILCALGNPNRTALEREEDATLQFKEAKQLQPDEMPQTLAEFRSSPKYILERQLREKEAFKHGSKSVVCTQSRLN